jgi:hypothetical protein
MTGFKADGNVGLSSKPMIAAGRALSFRAGCRPSLVQTVEDGWAGIAVVLRRGIKVTRPVAAKTLLRYPLGKECILCCGAVPKNRVGSWELLYFWGTPLFVPIASVLIQFIFSEMRIAYRSSDSPSEAWSSPILYLGIYHCF